MALPLMISSKYDHSPPLSPLRVSNDRQYLLLPESLLCAKRYQCQPVVLSLDRDHGQHLLERFFNELPALMNFP